MKYFKYKDKFYKVPDYFYIESLELCMPKIFEDKEGVKRKGSVERLKLNQNRLSTTDKSNKIYQFLNTPDECCLDIGCL